MAIMGLCAGLVACATVRQTAPSDLGLLTTALTEPVEALQDQADAGQARAQYAMAVLHAYGLRGVVRDPSRAELLRHKALAPHGYTPITTYIAGLNGKPGRVVIINTPRYDLDPGQALRIDQCARALVRDDHDLGIDACAGPAEFKRLSALWSR